ncbi:MAG TPA: NADH-quinone oxidoreductase subunit A [Gemmataceae bacterium]|nr:NADH-quinone oxidoreductase subunit A [Gemmataceae bacterium]
MTALVGYLLLFLAVGIGFIFVHLVAGKLVRPAKPEPEKLTIYECGEPTIGSAWVQFDLRFYVIALLFVIFDVEVAFFFPWAVVFGQANTLANPDAPEVQRVEAYRQLATTDPRDQRLVQDLEKLPALRRELAGTQDEVAARGLRDQIERTEADLNRAGGSARQFAWMAFWDILVFFGVLLVGFAYLWRRGDLAWVRSTASSEQAPAPAAAAPSAPGGQVLVGTGGPR